MTSHDRSQVSPTSWGLGIRKRWPGGAFPGLLDGSVLLVAWVALWTVFVLGVVAPAARFTGAVSAAQVEGSRT
ncbi:MAG TPA: hypothetical protein VFR85_08680 [Anaeromyxobacteraceae bacterium]|nr:hypothetical protein [Anaeromyxobacteraceae bacterium]